jgi:serine/threonine-protein kinase
MLVGQQLGPFLIEKEIGAGAMGAVYRGKYVKTGQIVAIKVMAPGLGTTAGSAAARFEREANILKQLNHPNIVRVYGIGKYHGTPYYAMEFIKGESLDHVMARRDRMTWEEVVDVGQQLCAALQHAHEHGIVHRDLKPSNLMILADGTLKLTDFGIAKDLDVTALTAANSTVGTAAYMSPEQCKGDRNLTYKSDLYSLGVVLYELITGKKPFTAENAMEMFMLHVQGKFERPSRVVLDVPVWMDNLICQLLEKNPEDRPRDAGMVGSVLGSIQEKVEAQEAAGMDAARARVMDRPRSQRATTREDRDAARTLLGRKPKIKKKPAGRRFIWLQALGLLLLLGGVVTALVVVLRPASADTLYRQAERLWTSAKPENRDRAREGPIRDYLRRFGDQNDEKTKQVRAWAEEYDVADYETKMDRYVRRQIKGVGLAVEARDDAEKMAFEAAWAEHNGDRDRATKLWQQILKDEGPAGLGLVARKHLNLLGRIDIEESRLLGLWKDIRAQKTEPSGLNELEKHAFLALRYEQVGDVPAARAQWELLREAAAKDPTQRFWVLFAVVKKRQLKDKPTRIPDKKEERHDAVQGLLDAISKAKTSLLDRRARLQDLVTLYTPEPDLADVVKQAKKMIDEIDAKMGRKKP